MSKGGVFIREYNGKPSPRQQRVIELVARRHRSLIGKQPPDMHVWFAKSEAPTFLEFEGPLSQDNPVWRIELIAPELDSSSGLADQIEFATKRRIRIQFVILLLLATCLATNTAN